MVSTLQSKTAVAGSTFILWALVAGSAVYWGLKLASGSGVVAAPVAARSPQPVDPAAVARLLGFSQVAAQAPSSPSLASRFALVGVVATRNSQGAALIAVDGKPAKPFGVGAPIEEGLVLQSVQGRRAVLSSSLDGPALVTLELPLKQ